MQKYLYSFLSILLHFSFCTSVNADDNVIELIADPVPSVDAQIFGKKVNLLVDTGIANRVVLNSRIANTLNLKAANFSAVNVLVGKKKLIGKARKVPVQVMGKITKIRTIWFDQDIVKNYDGIIGVGALGADRVKITFPDEKTSDILSQKIIRLKNKNGWKYIAKIEGKKIPVAFKAHHDFSVLNIKAVDFLKEQKLINETSQYEYKEIIFNLTAATVKLAVNEDFNSMLGFASPHIFGRIKNVPVFNNRQGKVSDAEIKEIIVTAQRTNSPKKSGRPPEIMLGRDALSGCMEMLYDFNNKNITLTCAKG